MWRINWIISLNFEALVPEANTSIQMIASGPISDREQIKLAFIKLITSAKKRVWIQNAVFSS